MNKADMSRLQDLRDRFGGVADVEFSEFNGQLRLRAFSECSEIEVFFQGAHVTHFSEKGKNNVLWLSPLANYQAGAAIRGGIPICWPWFGPCKFDKELPQHGFARNSDFALILIEKERNGSVKLVFRLESCDKSRAIWPHDFELLVEIVFGEGLKISMRTENTGDESFEVSQAIHSYFRVKHISELGIEGLNEQRYLDQLKGQEYIQNESILGIGREIDRVYESPMGSLSLLLGGKKYLRLSQENASDIVVWNPWIDKSKSMKDFPDLGYQEMVCVEAANGYFSQIILEPLDASHITQTLSL